ncbi:MAG: hypothetical protein IJ279_06315 [Clostridia bacterium]|nr:hypothetical protein [Clostridia bacterium]
MALIECTECKEEFSDKAEACPHCGCPTTLSANQKEEKIDKNIKSAKTKRIKPWMLITGIVVLLAVVVSVVIAILPSKYNWDEVILKSALPTPSSQYGDLHTNDADDLYLSVNRVTFSEYENYLNSCIEKGYAFVVESSGSSYTAFNKDGYELKLDYNEYNESIDISLNVRVSGTIKWSNSKLAALLPVPKANVGSIANDYTYGYEVYIGDITKVDFDTYISECEFKGFNLNIQKQENAFYSENALGYELVVEYYDCELMYISLNVPENIDDNEEHEKTTEDEEQNTEKKNDPSSTNSYTKNSYQTNTQYCVATGCTRKGTKTYRGISSETEYYCETHYDELISMMSDMEEDVGKGSYSKHTCEECSREGTHSIIGISGSTEYYCSTHYNELKEFMKIFQ